jgi:5-methylcytosine-specific restriction protein A
LKFCENCDSKLIKTKVGEKCPQCNKEELKNIIEISEKQKKTIIYNDINFPFEKGQYFLQKDVRKRLGCSLMTGINYNRNGNFLVIFMNAHDPKSQNNPYIDRFDSQTGLYHYTGKGKKGDQTLTGTNERLANSNKNNTDIHFFEQQNIGSNHKYVGLVKLEKIISTIQPDEWLQNRKVYEFLLRKIND